MLQTPTLRRLTCKFGMWMTTGNTGTIVHSEDNKDAILCLEYTEHKISKDGR